MRRQSPRDPYVYTHAGTPARRANSAEIAYARAIKAWIYNQAPLTQREVDDIMAKRAHKATYSSDKKNGGWIIRVEGPHAERFAGREVPVTMKGGDEHTEKLTKLVWVGTDKESGAKVALYQFEPKPRDQQAIEF